MGDRTSVGAKVAVLTFAVALMAGCYSVRRIEVSYDAASVSGDGPPELSVAYQASKINHPGSMTVMLEENPQIVTFTSCAMAFFVSGGPDHLVFDLPPVGEWKRVERYESVRGWVVTEPGKLRFGFGAAVD